MIKPMLPMGIMTLALLAGCSSEPASNAVTGNAVQLGDSEIIVPQGNVAEANAAHAAAAAPALNIAPDELTLVMPNGSAHHITFGMDKAATVRAVSAAAGAPIDQGTNRECGGGPLDYARLKGGLTLYFQEGLFAGWNLDGRAHGPYATAAGIGIGSTRSALESVMQVTVQDSTIGHEFMAGEMSGLLSAPTPDGRIIDLWAGITCIAR